MSRKNSSYSYKNHRKESNQKRQYKKNLNDSQESENSQEDRPDYKRIRVIQKNLVYAIGLPEYISTVQTLQGPLYFGRYGKVLKIILNKTSTPSKNQQRYTAYVTYSNQLDASLAILILDDLEIVDRPLKVSYGTTKYCSYFLKSQDCPNIKQCYFLHKWDAANQVTVDDNSKQVFNKQIKIAMKIVWEDIETVLKKYKTQKVNNIYNKSSEFPDIKYALNILHQNNYLSKEKLNTILGVQSNLQSNSVDNQKNKSQSASTNSSPQKDLSIDTIQTSQSNTKPLQIYSTVQQPTQVQIKQNQFPETVSTQTLIVQKLIQKLLVKFIMKQDSHRKSRLNFVKNNTIKGQQQFDCIKKYINMYLTPKKK